MVRSKNGIDSKKSSRMGLRSIRRYYDCDYGALGDEVEVVKSGSNANEYSTAYAA